MKPTGFLCVCAVVSEPWLYTDFCYVFEEGLKQLLVPLTERIRSDFSLSLTAIDATFKDSVQHLADSKVRCIKSITFNNNNYSW